MNGVSQNNPSLYPHLMLPSRNNLEKPTDIELVEQPTLILEDPLVLINDQKKWYDDCHLFFDKIDSDKPLLKIEVNDFKPMLY